MKTWKQYLKIKYIIFPDIPTLWSNAFDYSYLWTYFVGFICWDSSWFFHRHWSNSVIAHWRKLLSRVLMKKRQQHKPSQNTRKHKLKARCLGYTVIRIGLSDNTAFCWNYTRYKWNGTKVNKAFSNTNSHTHTYMHIHCCQLYGNPNSVSILLCSDGANFFKQYLASPHLRQCNLIVNMNVFPMCLKIGMTICCLREKKALFRVIPHNWRTV